MKGQEQSLVISNRLIQIPTGPRLMWPQASSFTNGIAVFPGEEHEQLLVVHGLGQVVIKA